MARDKVRPDLLIIIPPAGAKHTIFPPYGAMYISSALRQKGYNPAILNVDSERLTDKEVIKRVRERDPAYIGFSGIVAPSYGYIKEISSKLRLALPDKKQILGGGLASAAETVLKNTAIDIVVCGEGDITVVDLMDSLKSGNDLNNVPGIYYKDEALKRRFTGRRKLLMDLDTLPYPAFDLVDMNQYAPDGAEFIHSLSNGIKNKMPYMRKKNRRMMTIPTSRGCFNECSFCFRAYPGLRVHSIRYVFDLIEYCMEKFNVGFFSLGDECFAPTKARNWEFIEEYKRRKLDIVFRIVGMRVDTVDRDILRAYSQIGCWMIEYGFESGSQKMLDIINKRVTVEQNRQAATWTREAGIYTHPALVLAMPGETTETIRETIEFMKFLQLGFKQYLTKYAIPIPGSQLYEYAKITKAIEDEDAYLSSLTDKAAIGYFNINLTDEPDEVVAQWDSMLTEELDADYFYRKYRIRNRLLMRFMRFIMVMRLVHEQGALLQSAFKKIKRIALLAFYRKPIERKKPVRFRKKTKTNIDVFFKGAGVSSVNREISLKSINKKLREGITLEEGKSQ